MTLLLLCEGQHAIWVTHYRWTFTEVVLDVLAAETGTNLAQEVGFQVQTWSAWKTLPHPGGADRWQVTVDQSRW